MTSLEARLAKLEQAKYIASARVLSDVELAVRATWALETKAPGWEKLAEILGLPVEQFSKKEIK